MIKPEDAVIWLTNLLEDIGKIEHNELWHYEQALAEIKKDPTRAYAWQHILGKYNPSLLGECEKAISLSSEICSRWLQDNMLSDLENKESLSKEITEKLSSHEDSKTHSRRFGLFKCKDLG